MIRRRDIPPIHNQLMRFDTAGSPIERRVAPPLVTMRSRVGEHVALSDPNIDRVGASVLMWPSTELITVPVDPPHAATSDGEGLLRIGEILETLARVGGM